MLTPTPSEDQGSEASLPPATPSTPSAAPKAAGGKFLDHEVPAASNLPSLERAPGEGEVPALPIQNASYRSDYHGSFISGKEKAQVWDMQKVLLDLGEVTSEPRNGKMKRVKSKKSEDKTKAKSSSKEEVKVKISENAKAESVDSAPERVNLKVLNNENSESCNLNMNKKEQLRVEVAMLVALSAGRQEELRVARTQLAAAREERERLLGEQRRSREQEEDLRSRLVEEQARSARVEAELRSRLAGLRANNQQLASQQARLLSQPARPSIVGQLAMLATSQPQHLAIPLPCTRPADPEVPKPLPPPVSSKPLPPPGVPRPSPAPLTPAHARLVARLVARPALAGMAAAEVGTLVARVREERGGLTGLGVDEIAGEVLRLGREEECPVCLDTMVQGELTRCIRCRQLFHTRWALQGIRLASS